MKITIEIHDINDVRNAHGVLGAVLVEAARRRAAETGEVVDAEIVKEPAAPAQGGAPLSEPTGGAATGGAPAAAPEQPATKKPRKPRSDAGQPRGPYGPRTQEANAAGAGAPTDTPSTPNAGGEPTGSAPVPSAAPAAAASPETAAPAPAPQQASAAANVAPTPGAAPTLDDARAALGRINKTPGLGMPACMTHLQDFGVNRISAVKPEDYARFIKEADEKVAHAVTAAQNTANLPK